MKLKQTVFIDVDGTYYDSFKEDDKRIIRIIFKNNRIVKFLDDIAWIINSLDIFSNSFKILKLRFLIYSVLTGKKYNKVIQSYENLYTVTLDNNIKEKKELLIKLKEMYDVKFISSNPYVYKHMNEKEKFSCIYTKNTKQRYKKLNYYKKINNVAFLVGNNYTDDIKIAKKIGIKSFYIGQSKVFKYFNKTKSFTSFEKFVNYIIK